VTKRATHKSVFTILLLLLTYAIGTTGFFTAYYTAYHRQAFQVQVKETKPRELERLFFNEREFASIQWVETNTEFEWQGKMYDVSEIQKDPKGYVIICKNDTLEEMLLSFLKFTRDGKAGQGSKKGSPQPQFFSEAGAINLAIAFKENDHFAAWCNSFSHPATLLIFSPPPELCPS
jgi:hypothetical protein